MFVFYLELLFDTVNIFICLCCASRLYGIRCRNVVFTLDLSIVRSSFHLGSYSLLHEVSARRFHFRFSFFCQSIICSANSNHQLLEVGSSTFDCKFASWYRCVIMRSSRGFRFIHIRCLLKTGLDWFVVISKADSKITS